MDNKKLVTKLIDFSPLYLNDIIDLAKKRLGDGYSNSEELQRYANRPSNIFKLIIDAANGNLVGFFKMHGTNVSGLAKEFKLTPDEIRNVVGGNESICVAKSLVLQKECEKAGLATNLVRDTLEEAKQKGFYSCWSPLWVRKDGSIPAKKIMDRNDFKYYKNSHMVWVDDKEYKCIDCEGPCKCDAAVYYKIL